MTETSEADLLEIQPYEDSEVSAALSRVLNSPVSEKVRAAYFEKVPREQFAKIIGSIKSAAEFQEKIIAPAIDAVLAQSSDGFTISGFEKNSRDKKYVYISNHRDIICDPALFVFGLVRGGWDSPLICLGDNLMSSPWIIDLVKSNRGVTVKRGLSPRELLRWSYAISELLNRAVLKNQFSVWIAQREGRAKDGNDQTHSGVVKMLTLAGEAPFLDHLASLHLVPVAVSYEYDPCDALKARETYLSSLPGGYEKQPGEDVKSMGLGIRGYKGRIHIEVGSEIADTITMARTLPAKKDQILAIVAEINQQIHKKYKLWPSNFIAFDLLEGADRNSERYTAKEKQKFVERMEKQFSFFKDDTQILAGIRRCFLEMYANPLVNFKL